MGWNTTKSGTSARLGACAAVLALAAGLSGCASGPVAQRERAVYGLAGSGGDQGAWGELVFQSPEIQSALGETCRGPEHARRDDDLAVRGAPVLLATNEWPVEPRTSLERPRYLNIRDRDGRFTFFTEDPRRDRTPHHWRSGR